MSTIEPGDIVRVTENWIDSRQMELRLTKGSIYTVKARMGNTISLMGKPDSAWYFVTYFEKMVPDPVPLREAVSELAQALVDTRTRLGESAMPAREGWAWYDALKKHAPELLPKERCLAVILRGQWSTLGERYIRCELPEHESVLHQNDGTTWGDRAVGATYLKEQPSG